jgi:hypothetical protein
VKCADLTGDDYCASAHPSGEADKNDHVVFPLCLPQPDVAKSSSLQIAGELAPKRTKRIDAVVDEDYDFTKSVTIKNTARDEFLIFGEHVSFKAI